MYNILKSTSGPSGYSIPQGIVISPSLVHEDVQSEEIKRVISKLAKGRRISPQNNIHIVLS